MCERSSFDRGVDTIPPWGIFVTVTTTAKPGYSATKEQLLKRLRRVEGQIRGVENMVASERYCIDVLTQISAAQAALDKVALALVNDHVSHCVLDAEGTERDEKVNELLAAMARMTKRG